MAVLSDADVDHQITTDFWAGIIGLIRWAEPAEPVCTAAIRFRAFASTSTGGLDFDTPAAGDAFSQGDIVGPAHVEHRLAHHLRKQEGVADDAMPFGGAPVAIAVVATRVIEGRMLRAS